MKFKINQKQKEEVLPIIKKFLQDTKLEYISNNIYKPADDDYPDDDVLDYFTKLGFLEKYNCAILSYWGYGWQQLNTSEFKIREDVDGPVLKWLRSVGENKLADDFENCNDDEFSKLFCEDLVRAVYEHFDIVIDDEYC